MDIDKYRERMAQMRLGDLLDELIQLRLSQPEGAKDKIRKTQKIKEVVYQLNQREVSDDNNSRESRRTAVRNLKSLL